MTRTRTMGRFWWSLVALGALAVAFAVALPAMTARGADHLDAPGLTSPGSDGRLDINDVYAFQSPTNPDNTILMMTVNPLSTPGATPTYHPKASYEFLIDTDGDAEEDIKFKIRFSEPNSDGVQKVKFRGHGLKGKGVTGADIQLKRGGMAHVGVFDDPFFFDLVAFLGAGGRSFCDGGQFDFFAGFNVSAIVLEVPSEMLHDGHHDDDGHDSNIGVWARTMLDGDQIDRMGRPGINTIFIPDAFKNAFNEGEPEDDVEDFSVFLGALSGLLLPDILTVDTASTAGFLNGRQMADDVIDISLQVITGDPSAGDCVDANDVAFPGVFPYLASPHS